LELSPKPNFTSIAEINQSEKAKKKIANIAKNNNLEYELVYPIMSFYWNYDEWAREALGWVDIENIKIDDEYNKKYETIYKILGLTDETFDKNYVAEKIYNKIKEIDEKTLENNFLEGSQNKNYCYISEYASFYYLTNASVEKLQTLDWSEEKLTRENIIFNIFKKIFRGGSVDRYNLKYLYTDLVVKLPYKKIVNHINDWTKEFIQNIEAQTLTDLIKEVKQYCKGDKYFYQTILEALSYCGKLKIKGHEIENKFIPDFRNELSKNFYANEWTYPLRFWSTK
jgi:hypothetical protein